MGLNVHVQLPIIECLCKKAMPSASQEQNDCIHDFSISRRYSGRAQHLGLSWELSVLDQTHELKTSNFRSRNCDMHVSLD